MKKIIEDVITAYIIEFELDFERITDYSKADLKLSFSTVAEDENLDANTIAYMGYPLTGSPFWGICVINKSFTYSHDGKPLTGEEMIKKGIQVQFPNATYQTLYLVKILMHEFGHGILGLPHDPRRGSVMSYSEGTMSEYWSDRDLVRGYAKVKRKTRSQSMLDRLRAWFKIGGKR